MTLSRLALTGLLVAGSLVLVAYLLASPSDEPLELSAGLTADDALPSVALGTPPLTSVVTCVVPPGFGSAPGAMPSPQRCSESLPGELSSDTAMITEC